MTVCYIRMLYICHIHENVMYLNAFKWTIQPYIMRMHRHYATFCTPGKSIINLLNCGQVYCSAKKCRRTAHIAFIVSELLEYWKRRDKAILHTDQYCIILDGANQSAFGLPHFVTGTKDTRGESLILNLLVNWSTPSQTNCTFLR